MKEQLINFETAKLAKEKGFNAPTPFIYICSGRGKEKTHFLQDYFVFYKSFLDLHTTTSSNRNDLKDVERNGSWDNSITTFTLEDYHKSYNPFADDYKVLAPTQSLLQKWLREVHGIYVNSEYDLNHDGKNIIYFSNWGFINDPSSDNYKYNPNGGYDEKAIWKTYEEALEIGLQEGLKLLSDEFY